MLWASGCATAPWIGRIDHNLTLKQAALANGVSEELFDRVVDPLALTRGGSADLPDRNK
jgi:hypothetical protein